MPRHVEDRLAAVEATVSDLVAHLWGDQDREPETVEEPAAPRARIVPDESGTWRTVIGPDGAEHRVNGQAAAERLAAEIEGGK